MKTIRLLQEDGVQIDIKEIAENLSRICSNLEFVCGSTHLVIKDEMISYPDSYGRLDAQLKTETKNDFRAVLITKKRYDNNYFYYGRGNRIILSFFAWDHLTKLPMNNGLVFFLADFIALYIDHSSRHDDDPKPECIYDFGWNKAGVDLGMRSALICPKCMTRINGLDLNDFRKGLFDDLQIILNDLGSASKWETDIVEFWKTHNRPSVSKIPDKRNQVFISYSHDDSDWLRRLKMQFRPFERTAVIEVWDDTRIGTGDDWQKSIKQALRSTKVAVLLVSPAFLSSEFIANEELPNLLEAARDEGAVIMPIILKPCGFERIPSISKFQAVNSPSRTLIEMSEGDQERFLLKLTEDVLSSLT